MKNKEAIAGVLFSRPCFYSFQEESTGLYWLIPISSKVEKYKAIYKKIVEKHDKCDTIFFSEVMRKQRAFLIQNMCPTTEEYIADEYINPVSNSPVRIDIFDEQELIYKARSVLYYVHNGNKKLIFPDVLKIEKKLLGR